MSPSLEEWAEQPTQVLFARCRQCGRALATLVVAAPRHRLDVDRVLAEAYWAPHSNPCEHERVLPELATLRPGDVRRALVNGRGNLRV